MQDKTLLKIALITSILGLLFIFFLSRNISFDKSSLITSDNLDSYITVEGRVTSIQSSDSFTTIKVVRQETIEIILFDDINLTKDQIIEVSGQLKQEDNKNKIIAEEIKIIT